jgi:EAL domain-containing protein (putative c-di-GMP-specific phosphodiesterase class I)
MEFIRHLAAETGPRISLIIASALDRKLIASIGTMTRAYGLRLLGIAEKPLTLAKLRELVALHHPQQRASAGPRSAPLSFTQDEILAGLQRDEFEPFLQPKVELATRSIQGAEALARWRHPQHGIVAPAAFIPLLEQRRLIDELTWSMLRKSAALCARWRSAGMNISLSVNVSLTSLSGEDLSDRVLDIVRSEGVDPAQMILEITESAATTDTARALENLARLRMNGFGLSIDDYGTGYSSMQQLSRIAFTELKIDRSFVADSSREESTRVILASSLDMARKLNIKAVAEGVETQADWDLLRELGCDMAQGFLIAKPMEAHGFLVWAQGWDRMG